MEADGAARGRRAAASRPRAAPGELARGTPAPKGTFHGLRSRCLRRGKPRRSAPEAAARSRVEPRPRSSPQAAPSRCLRPAGMRLSQVRLLSGRDRARVAPAGVALEEENLPGRGIELDLRSRGFVTWWSGPIPAPAPPLRSPAAGLDSQ